LKKLVFILTLAVFVVSGCATTKQRPFVEITDIPQGKGVIYIYMPKKNFLKSAEIRVDNADGIGTYVGNIIKGTYIPYVAPVGENLFKIGTGVRSIGLEEGESKFIRIKSYKVFFSVKTKLEVVDPSAGFAQIRSVQQR
jgi:hypothetical protein